MVTPTGDIGRRAAFFDMARVLVADDEPDAGVHLPYRFVRVDHARGGARDGRNGLRRVPENACDAPVRDLPMPVRDVADEAQA